MTDNLPDRYLRARLTPIRQQLWDNGEITIAGLARLDREIGVDTYAEEREEPMKYTNEHGPCVKCDDHWDDDEARMCPICEGGLYVCSICGAAEEQADRLPCDPEAVRADERAGR